MKVQYIGKNDKTDSINGVGLRWTPGQVHDVTNEVAERLCVYTDTWKKVGVGKDEPIGLEHMRGDPEMPLKQPAALEPDKNAIGLRPDEKPVEEPLPVVDLHSMDKQAMIEYAREKLNVRIDKKLSTTDVRHKVTDALAKHHHDNDSGQGLS